MGTKVFAHWRRYCRRATLRRLRSSIWVMLGMTGPQICPELRASARTAATFAILLTARNTPEDIVAGPRSGADDYVTKPVQPEEVRARVAAGRRIVELQACLAA